MPQHEAEEVVCGTSLYLDASDGLSEPVRIDAEIAKSLFGFRS